MDLKILQESMKEWDERIANGEDPDIVIPRIAYMGHELINTFTHPDKTAVWECVSCEFQWRSVDGHTCPSCNKFKD